MASRLFSLATGKYHMLLVTPSSRAQWGSTVQKRTLCEQYFISLALR